VTRRRFLVWLGGGAALGLAIFAAYSAFQRAQAAAPIPEISLETFQAAVRDKTAQVIDARPPYFFGKGHVPGAFNLPAADAAQTPLPFPKDAPLIVYCSDPGCTASLTAARALRARGYRDVRRFPGGIAAWQKAGLSSE
jgi:rhodanese-related sulfurtransferase